MSKAWNRRLEKARAFLAEGNTIWYRRGPFHALELRDKEPKWHIFVDRKDDIGFKGRYIWVAKCGYEKSFAELYLDEYPQLNLSKTPPKVTERCLRCIKKEEQNNG